MKRMVPMSTSKVRGVSRSLRESYGARLLTEEEDPGENRANGSRHSLRRVARLPRDHAHRFTACVQRSRHHEDLGHTRDAVGVGARILPISAADVPLRANTADVDDDGDDEKDEDGDDLDEGEL